MDLLRAKISHGFDLLDADGDGALTEADHVTMGHRVRRLPARPHPGHPQADLDEAFAHLDLDGDGTLTATEFERAVIEYWSSTDPDAPGTWWMGRPAFDTALNTTDD
ncbi:MAG: hypothetical protein HOV87_03750 [Catenulispora sp.]|nr:hypothetical protein [Catenulispora sp.]